MFTYKDLKELNKKGREREEQAIREEAEKSSKKAAIILSTYYDCLRKCKFTEEQAMEIIKTTILAQNK